jgi:hypothetical protein
MARTKKSQLSLRKGRSAVTNGRFVLANIDHRIKPMRRLRDLINAHVADMGGEGLLSCPQRALLQRSSMLILQCEMMESSWQGGLAAPDALDRYQRCVNSLRRVVETLGLHLGRRPKDVTALEDNTYRAFERELHQ